MNPDEQIYYDQWKARALVFLAALQADFPGQPLDVLVPLASDLALGAGFPEVRGVPGP